MGSWGVTCPARASLKQGREVLSSKCRARVMTPLTTRETKVWPEETHFQAYAGRKGWNWGAGNGRKGRKSHDNDEQVFLIHDVS